MSSNTQIESETSIQNGEVSNTPCPLTDANKSVQDSSNSGNELSKVNPYFSVHDFDNKHNPKICEVCHALEKNCRGHTSKFCQICNVNETDCKHNIAN